MGDVVGLFVGDVVGFAVGRSVSLGLLVGDVVGALVGEAVGDVVGLLLGDVVADLSWAGEIWHGIDVPLNNLHHIEFNNHFVGGEKSHPFSPVAILV